jgi:uncharacterized protein
VTDRREERLGELRDYLRGLGRVVVAYSGGVDSTFLAVVAHEVLGADMAAVMGLSPSVARREREDARRVAEQFGLTLVFLPTGEMENPLYVANGPDRCFHCKEDLFSRLKRWAREHGFEVVVDGTNADDHEDFRPGLEAARRLGIRSPLAELGWSKEEIRSAARALGIPLWCKPASPCLASRIPHGVPIREELLKRVDVAEERLRQLGFRAPRVRAHEELARLELAPGDWERLRSDGIQPRVVRAVKEAGFRFVTVDLEGYRPAGSHAKSAGAEEGRA